MKLVARHINIKGLVQGVGFRPFIYRHAAGLSLKGWVRNHSGGVEVVVEGQENNCNDFLTTLESRAPRSSVITTLEEKPAMVGYRSSFIIRPSIDGSCDVTNISPDIAICPDCLRDIMSKSRRFNYPFTNCAHCGPRFSITGKIPYDRKNTAMSNFEMCDDCDREYRNITDRRFHAQTISCEECGPRYCLITSEYEEYNFERILVNLSSLIEGGNIIAVKGTGGFQLICDARNEASVKRIREIKQRNSKPVAVMFRDLETVKKFARVNKSEESLLLNWRRPIVILEAIKILSSEINRGFTTLGAILPYSAFHNLLMQKLKTPAIVFTSANLKGRPLISENKDAADFFKSHYCDALLYHNRQILNRQDDSIVRSAGGGTSIIRRARSFVPEPVMLNRSVDGILAMGADLKNSFCIGKGDRAIMSQYIGDLEEFEVFHHYCKTIADFSKIFKFNPKVIVIDNHPEYHSSRYGRELAMRIPDSSLASVICVQHHHAHIASVMAEHNIEEKVIGIAMDGTGFGDDGKIWGSEYLVCDLESYKRVYHLAYIPLSGGEKAIREPWRLAVAAAYRTFGEEYLDFPLPFNKFISRGKQLVVIKALKNNLNIYESGGMGRLFDTVAALINIVHISDFDGEGPLKLENIYCQDAGEYPVNLLNDQYSYESVISGIISDILAKVPNEVISGRFHNTVSTMICDGAERIRNTTGLNKVVLSGGVFQNKIITEMATKHLNEMGFSVFTNRQVPCNDGGIALGQLAIASIKINKNVSEHTCKS